MLNTFRRTTNSGSTSLCDGKAVYTTTILQEAKQNADKKAFFRLMNERQSFQLASLIRSLISQLYWAWAALQTCKSWQSSKSWDIWARSVGQPTASVDRTGLNKWVNWNRAEPISVAEDSLETARQHQYHGQQLKIFLISCSHGARSRQHNELLALQSHDMWQYLTRRLKRVFIRIHTHIQRRRNESTSIASKHKDSEY